MKTIRFASVVTAVVLCVSVLTGCNRNSAGSTGSGAGSSQPVSSAAVSSAASASSAAPVSSAAAVSSAAEVSSERSAKPAVDEAKFNAYFKSNPIDKAYDDKMVNAVSTKDMVTVNSQFADIWKNEITSAYNRLMSILSGTEKERVVSEQSQWEQGKDAAIRKIGDDAAKIGGTLSQITASGDVMNYYKTRAKALYMELFAYDPSYKYAYAG